MTAFALTASGSGMAFAADPPGRPGSGPDWDVGLISPCSTTANLIWPVLHRGCPMKPIPVSDTVTRVALLQPDLGIRCPALFLRVMRLEG